MDQLEEKVREFSRAVMVASVEDVKKLRCPGCGKSIRITYVATEKGDLWLQCRPCFIIYEFHGVGPSPPWFDELGGTIITEPPD